jgi:hypothetical protein
MLSQLSYTPKCLCPAYADAVPRGAGIKVDSTGFEPVTPAVSRRCSPTELNVHFTSLPDSNWPFPRTDTRRSFLVVSGATGTCDLYTKLM